MAAIEKAGIRAYTALPDQGKRTSLFTIEDFSYDAEKDLYTCPRGEVLRRRGRDRRGGYVRYAASASSCNPCPLKSKCTKSPKGRWLSRGLEEEYLERVRAYRETEAYRKALRKRGIFSQALPCGPGPYNASGRAHPHQARPFASFATCCSRKLGKVAEVVRAHSLGPTLQGVLHLYQSREPHAPGRAATCLPPELGAAPQPTNLPQGRNARPKKRWEKGAKIHGAEEHRARRSALREPRNAVWQGLRVASGLRRT
ncbi:MAG: transposase [Rubrobacteraceae bacterium]|nr:transposase [Rubrobacteraceae bacterium]